jgi:hypothetical protein
MTTDNGNDNAFPMDSGVMDNHGLTKREYLAAMAMQGLLSNSRIAAIDFDNKTKVLCAGAIEHADELLKQLQNSQP